MIRPEDYEQNEQEKLEEAQGGRDENLDEDSDYFSFKRSQERALASEYGSELSKDDEMDETGNYKFDTDNATNLEEIFRRREKIYTYYQFKDVLNGMDPNEVFPHLEDLEKAGVMTNIHRRVKNNVFLGLDFKKDNSKVYRRLINRRRDDNGRLTDGFEYSKDKNSEDVIKLFKMRLKEARRMYEERPTGAIEDEIRSVMSDEDDDNSSVMTKNKALGMLLGLTRIGKKYLLNVSKKIGSLLVL